LAEQLANPGLDPAELAEDELARLGASERPVTDRLEVLQDGVEAIGQVGDDVIVVERSAVPGVERRRRIANEDGAGDEPLQVGSTFQDVVEGRGRIRQAVMLSVPITTRR